MSGVLNVLITSRGDSFLVTIAALGTSGYVGYNSGDSSSETTPAGSLSPVAAIKGATLYWILSADSTSPTVDLEINLSGTRSQSFFTGVRIMDGDGTVRTRLTENASLVTATADGGSRWQWSGESTAIWDDADIGEIRRVEFF